jgi:hypothetical protein
MADQFDFKQYPMAMIQFGPSIVIGDRWIGLATIQQIINIGDGCLKIQFKHGEYIQLDEEGSRIFHDALIAGAKNIQTQIDAAQSAQAAQAARNLGIIKTH